MKKVLFISFLCVSMFFLTFSIAENQDGTQITDTLRQAGITDPVQLSQWDDTAVCFSEIEGKKRLVVLEKKENFWQIKIDNPTALIQDADWPELYLESDNSIYWTYLLSDQEVLRYL